MTPTTRRRSAERIAEDQRRRVLAAALRVFAQRGYANTVIRHVIEPAGISRRTFYELYGGMEEVFDEALAEAHRALEKRLDAACSAGADWHRRVALGVNAVLDLGAGDPLRVQLIVGEPLIAGPRQARCRDLLVERFAPFLRSGRRPGPALCPDLEEALICGLAGVIAQRLRAGQAASLPDLAPDLTEFVLTPYRVDRRRPEGDSAPECGGAARPSNIAP